MQIPEYNCHVACTILIYMTAHDDYGNIDVLGDIDKTTKNIKLLKRSLIYLLLYD